MWSYSGNNQDETGILTRYAGLALMHLVKHTMLHCVNVNRGVNGNSGVTAAVAAAVLLGTIVTTLMLASSER
jgi:hypothetical protein